MVVGKEGNRWARRMGMREEVVAVDSWLGHLEGMSLECYARVRDFQLDGADDGSGGPMPSLGYRKRSKCRSRC